MTMLRTLILPVITLFAGCNCDGLDKVADDVGAAPAGDAGELADVRMAQEADAVTADVTGHDVSAFDVDDSEDLGRPDMTPSPGCATDTDCENDRVCDEIVAVCVCPEERSVCGDSCCEWTTEVIELPNTWLGGVHPSLWVDDQSAPHVLQRARRAAGGRPTAYSFFGPDGWELRYTDSAPNGLWQTDVVVGPDEVVYLAYSHHNENNTKDLIIGRWYGPEDIERTIVGSADFGTSASMVFVGETLYVAYEKPSGASPELTLASGSVGAFTEETVTLPHSISWTAELRASDDGRLYFAYGSSGDAVVYGERGIGGDWTFEEIGADPSTSPVSLRLDSKGEPHVAYYQTEVGDLHYARRVDGVWRHETVVTDGDTGYAPALALDEEDRPHIFFHDIDHYAFRHAARVTTGGATGWSIGTVAIGTEEQPVGLHSDADFGPDGRLHVVFEHQREGLRYGVISP